ncbi:MAG: hypothetical protein J4469_02855 [Candidatus Aenigmarchaeota archaeon]|nr:hypothetical protein [Candidatus Aenigmarchaeota archaeon]
MSGKRFLEVVSGFYIAVIHTNRIIDMELDGIGSSTGLGLSSQKALAFWNLGEAKLLPRFN